MGLSHIDESGAARMVDVSAKPVTDRTAKAQALVTMNQQTFALLQANQLQKGDSLQVSRIAGILAAKRVDELIPLCHTLPLSSVEVNFELDESASTIRIETKATTCAQTGVEMEAITAATIAALTLYDMAKSSDKAIQIGEIRLLQKTGGKSGDYQWSNPK